MDVQAETLCPLDCPDTCSLSVTVRAGRVARVDGSTRNPFTGGFICAKVRRYPERLYGPDRVLYPQRRVGPKGEARFERVSWDDALNLVAERFRHIIAEDGPAAIVPYHYGGSNGLFSDGAMDARFFHRLGAAEIARTLCAAPTSTVYRAMFGTLGGVPPQDYPLARSIILWGVNPSATSIHLVPQVRAARDAGAFVAAIDPRRTPLARAADLHLQPLPGTDIVLALAMIHELIRSGRAALPFIHAHASGFAALAGAAARYSLADAAKICDVPAPDIERLLDAYVNASPAVLRCGWGIERNRNGGNAARAIFALPVVAGKFGVRGGGLTMSLSRSTPIDQTALARPDLRARPARTLNMVQLGRWLTEPLSPPVRALFVYNANPVASTPDQNRILRGLAREDLFTVVHDQVLTDTARFADVLLPATTVFEHTELKRSYGHFALQYAEPVVAPAGEALSNHALFARLARAMGFEEPAFGEHETALLDVAVAGSGAALGPAPAEALRRERIAWRHFGGERAPVPFVEEFPSTPSGKVELMPPELGPIAYQPLPASPYPLAFMSPASGRTINSIFGEWERPDVQVTIHPDDAAARGIADGDVVRVYNELGEVLVPARVRAEVRPGVVALPKGLWRRHTRNGSTGTALAPDTLGDIAGGACYNDARVEVVRV
jgi:anaerobic selenocysteine-containing dehydrogenase